MLESLTSIRTALKNVREIPANGLAIFSGPGILELIEPSNPLRLSTYMCDKHFHVGAVLDANNSSGNPYGIVILDGTGVIVGICDGTRRSIVGRISVDLPSKHGRGGQSALRFSRLAEEARTNYITKACDLVTRSFVTNGIATVCGLVIGGVGELKHKLVDRLPESLGKHVKSVIELAYGGMDGFMTACAESEKTMANSLLSKERSAVAQLESEIQKDGCYALGKSVIQCMEAGAVSELLLYPQHADAEQILQLAEISGVAKIHRISDSTPEGSRFIHGLTGVGAILRFRVHYHEDEGDVEGVGVGVEGVGVTDSNDANKNGDCVDIDFM